MVATFCVTFVGHLLHGSSVQRSYILHCLGWEYLQTRKDKLARSGEGGGGDGPGGGGGGAATPLVLWSVLTRCIPGGSIGGLQSLFGGLHCTANVQKAK